MTAELVVRGAHVLTMDPELGDLARGDVHVKDGRIAAVGPDLDAGGETIDGRDTIVLPGLVDTHWHMWTALHRSMAGSGPENGYFPLNRRLGQRLEPVDLYRGVRLALAEAVCSGITTVHDWSHNVRGPKFADASLRAHVEAGLRGRFSYGEPQGHPVDRTIDLADLERVQREWFAAGAAPLLHLGLAGRPPPRIPASVYRAELDAARTLRLPISYHVNARPGSAAIAALGAEGMLGPDVQLVHAIYTSPAERALVAEAGASVSISPWAELLIGYGAPPVRDLLDAGILLTLSVDTLALTGTADMFSIMRLTLGLHRAQAEEELSLAARRVLEMATIEGARALGIAHLTGSLTPGKRADLIIVRTDEINVAPLTDPANAIVLAAQPANVDTVIVDGRILKRHGRLTALDVDRVVAEAAASLAAVLARD